MHNPSATAIHVFVLCPAYNECETLRKLVRLNNMNE